MSPYINYDYQATFAFVSYTIVVEAKDNYISVPYTFEKEDMYSINVNAPWSVYVSIVITKLKNDHDILDALKYGRSVAVEIANGIPMCYGNHRFVKNAQFLIRYHFPKRDATVKKEAQFIKERCILKTISKEYGEEV